MSHYLRHTLATSFPLEQPSMAHHRLRLALVMHSKFVHLSYEAHAAPAR
jgi:hypothetical protein